MEEEIPLHKESILEEGKTQEFIQFVTKTDSWIFESTVMEIEYTKKTRAEKGLCTNEDYQKSNVLVQQKRKKICAKGTVEGSLNPLKRL